MCNDEGKDTPTTSDSDVVRRGWLFIDFDPDRPSGISATDAEKELAHARAREVMAALRTAGWPDPILADSGNGWHLLYRIDLPADDDGLVQRVLQALALTHGGAGVTIDTSVHTWPKLLTAFTFTFAARRATGRSPERSLLPKPRVEVAGCAPSGTRTKPGQNRDHGACRDSRGRP